VPHSASNFNISVTFIFVPYHMSIVYLPYYESNAINSGSSALGMFSSAVFNEGEGKEVGRSNVPYLLSTDEFFYMLLP